MSAVILLAIPVRGADAQQIRLASPIATTKEYFTDISSAVRVGDGEWIVADPGGEELVYVAPARNELRVLGRQGDGPGEYRTPQCVLPFGRSGALLFDPRARRFTEWDSAGKFLASYSAGSVNGAYGAPTSSDEGGRVFFNGFDPASRVRETPIVAWHVRTGGMDTVGSLRMATLVDVTPSSVRDDKRPAGRSWQLVPYANADVAMALADGSLMVARGATGGIEWRARSGQLRGSARFPGKRIPMPDSLRDRVPAALRRHLDTYLPLFDDYGAVRSTKGRIWIRASAFTALGWQWFGFSASEAIPTSLMLPKGSRLIAVDEPYYVVATRTPSELQRLDVYRVR
jgi:hypothetical protein